MPLPLTTLGLTEPVLDQPVTRLSSGERQRLALLRLLANRPRVLLLDEPTANLDTDNTRRIESVISEYSRTNQAAVIWISHDRTQVTRVANRHMELRNGTLEESARETRQ